MTVSYTMTYKVNPKKHGKLEDNNNDNNNMPPFICVYDAIK